MAVEAREGGGEGGGGRRRPLSLKSVIRKRFFKADEKATMVEAVTREVKRQAVVFARIQFRREFPPAFSCDTCHTPFRFYTEFRYHVDSGGKSSKRKGHRRRSTQGSTKARRRSTYVSSVGGEMRCHALEEDPSYDVLVNANTVVQRAQMLAVHLIGEFLEVQVFDTWGRAQNVTRHVQDAAHGVRPMGFGE